jgi:hypothetical protein
LAPSAAGWCQVAIDKLQSRGYLQENMAIKHSGSAISGRRFLCSQHKNLMNAHQQLSAVGPQPASIWF